MFPATFSNDPDYDYFTYALPDFPVGTQVEFWLKAANIIDIGYGQEAGSDYSFSVTGVEDSDNDGLKDVWEDAHFGNLDQTATDNTDGDGSAARPLDNIIEQTLSLSPLVPNDSTGVKLIWAPSYPTPGGQVTLSYFYVNEGNPLFGKPVYAHLGKNGWQDVYVSDQLAVNGAEGRLEVTIDVPVDATEINVVFNDQAGTWDNNNGQDWTIPVQPIAP